MTRTLPEREGQHAFPRGALNMDLYLSGLEGRAHNPCHLGSNPSRSTITTQGGVPMDAERPGYYAIIPADVRYDDRIPANAKLLYGEISALIGAAGFCYASNQYFANVYGMSCDSITRLISKLEEAGYIKRELEKDKSGQVVRRKIFLSVSVPQIQPPGVRHGRHKWRQSGRHSLRPQ